jgi:hypothetical protein
MTLGRELRAKRPIKRAYQARILQPALTKRVRCWTCRVVIRLMHRSANMPESLSKAEASSGSDRLFVWHAHTPRSRYHQFNKRLSPRDVKRTKAELRRAEHRDSAFAECGEIFLSASGRLLFGSNTSRI